MPSLDRLVFRYPAMVPADPERIERLWMRADAVDGELGDPYRLRPFEGGLP
jgi:hypothetical protein